MDLQDIDIAKHLHEIKKGKEYSQLGFFSKPYRIDIGTEGIVVKVYHPIKKNSVFLIEAHNKYIADLKRCGINVPDTRILAIEKGIEQELVILQQAFEKEELVRTIFEEKPLETLLQLLSLMYSETIEFWKKKSVNDKIGFHPTIRNYAFRKGSLFYYDTFPPMGMPQDQLNKIIVQMTPISDWLKWLKHVVPTRIINKVSDEYYFVEKTIVGILGSSIRLRPEYAEEFLKFTKWYIERSALGSKEKKYILQKIDSPPKLSLLWRIMRKLTKNVGKPNISFPIKKQIQD